MVTALSLLLLLTGCLGWGAVLLLLMGLLNRLRQGEALAWSFALGQGVWGWLMFWIGTSGHLNVRTVAAGLLAGAIGCLLLRRTVTNSSAMEGGRLHPLLILATVGFVAMLALEAVSPPTDTDSLAYHFALARDFTQAGRIVFVARAIDSAVPLMVQMHYTAAFALGGETVMTAWAATLSVAMVLILYVLARIWLNRNWSAMTALAFATLPATIYGAGSGQVEVKLGLVVVIGGLAAARAVELGCIRHAAAAGWAAGCFMASKYTGLLFAVAAGLVLLLPPQRWRLAPAFTATALLAGFQWYGWNWIHIGDPLFPMLRPWLPPSDPSLWPMEFDTWHKAKWNEGEISLSRTPWSLMIYPFLATFAPPAALDAARVGIGFLPMTLAPFALAALWRKPASPDTRLLWRATAPILIFAVLWFALGASQRIRHFLPIIPLLLLAAVVAAERTTRRLPARRPVLAALILAILLQLTGQSIYVYRYVADWMSGLSREEIFRKRVSYGDVVIWINHNLKGDVRLIHNFRFLSYLLDIPYYDAHQTNQALVDMSPSGDDSSRFLAGMCRVGGTHVLANGSTAPDGAGASVMSRRLHHLVEQGLAEPVITLSGSVVNSRTLVAPNFSTPFGLYKLRCPASLAIDGKIR